MEKLEGLVREMLIALGENPELKDTVTLRDRDSMKQDRVKIADLVPLISQKLRG